MSTFKDISCPACNAKLCAVIKTMVHHGSHVCNRCHKRIHIDFDPKTLQVIKRIER